MRKISDIVTEMVVTQPFLEEALHYGYLNLTGFAEYIRPYVEKEACKSVSIHAIKMALSRMKRPETLSRRAPAFKPSQMATLSDLSIMSVPRSLGLLKEIHSVFSQKPESVGYRAIVEGSSEIDVVFSAQFRESLHEAIPEEFRVLEVDGLSLCSLRLSDAEIYQKGLFYGVTKQLAFHGINIIQVLSTYHELGIVVRTEDLKKTATVLLG